MPQSQVQTGEWTLSADREMLLLHKSDFPFATALRREKSYSVNRGTVKETVREVERIPLTEVSAEEGSVVLSGGGHSLRVVLRTEDLGFRLCLTGEAGWGYEFRLPAGNGEAVFGGGEQYRQVNLRGEQVVNLVSEHIQATTVLQKALLPRALYREKPHEKIGSYAPMPVFVTDRGRLIRFDADSDGITFFGRDAYVFTFDRCPRELLLLEADRFEPLTAALTKEAPNRQYLPDWCMDGMILGVQGGTQTVLDKAFAMQDAG
ncbi:MAG: hypothetical protein II382_04925, partial [Oscillospiraceae bacterium]|nr:hypothetical protein [Oscillospiraceae bacterium]